MAYILRLLFVSLFLGPVLSLRAADEEKKIGTDSISANRKDLEALRTDQLLAPQQKLSLPLELNGAGLGTPSPAQPNLRQKPRDDLEQPKSGGWLVDAMEKNSGRKARDSLKSGKTDELDSRRRQNMEDREPANPASTGERPGMGMRGNENEREREASTALKAGAKALNPLNGYMSAWMTPGDYTLLQKPAIAAGGMLRGTLPEFTGQSSASLPGLPAELDRTMVESKPGEPQLTLVGVRENPYLQLLTAGSSPAGGLMNGSSQPQRLEPGPAAPRASPMLLPPPLEPARVSPLIQDNLKRSDDQKYFPQLKRF